MVTLTRAEGNWAGDLDLTRRSIALALAGGYAVAAFSAEADPIHTDDKGLVTETVQIQAADRKIPGYLARPAGKGKHPVVFVYSEVFGVHEWVKDICRRLAKAGYVALAPDLFIRTGDPSTTTDMKVVMEIVRAQPDAQVTSDTAASLKFLAAQPYADMKRLGVTGFCWGGGAVWVACERFPEFKAGVAWYGPLKAGPYPRTPPIDLVKDLKCPVLGLYGGQDKGIPAADIEAMRAAIKAAGKDAEIVVYPDAQHGFLADYRPSYNAEASADGWKRMLAFFKAHGVA
ncbi:dienelactone hydrolase family protein [Phenylobacterium sp.]|jgi:carboxymethylenebutenolidase|uniref:dienelactone hydrolase family protein n=1 Tax=Phenylobacterium sp. TaxID=1871053 RepID=UPI002E33EA2D|nr:dienelactone hydrolase family protein [Phenylobacterium sp.]HEX4712195.1 dienelactone hydrolase family protein [Phenylobacterium sp.]